MPELTKIQIKRCNVPIENKEEYYIICAILIACMANEIFLQIIIYQNDS